MNYWLMKSEPHVYPWEMLVEDGETHWDGVRNYQARNMMRDDMKLGDLNIDLEAHSNLTAESTPLDLLDEIVNYSREIGLKIVLDSHSRGPEPEDINNVISLIAASSCE